MQDTILSMCKESVRDFVKFMIQFIPKETHVTSTKEVKNVFEKPHIENDEEAEQIDEIPDSEMTTV